MAREYKLPPAFVTDCLECGCDVGEVMSRAGGAITLRCTVQQLSELVSRARYYADPDGPDMVSRGLKASAKATLDAIANADAR